MIHHNTTPTTSPHFERPKLKREPSLRLCQAMQSPPLKSNHKNQHHQQDSCTVTTFDADQSFSSSSLSCLDYHHSNVIVTMSPAAPALATLEPQVVQQVLSSWKRASNALEHKKKQQQQQQDDRRRSLPTTRRRRAPSRTSLRRITSVLEAEEEAGQPQASSLEEHLGQVLLEHAQRLLTPTQYDKIFGTSSNGSNADAPSSPRSSQAMLLLQSMATHMRAVRIGSFIQELVETLKTKDTSEFHTLLCTYWRQQHMMGWNLQVSQLIAFCQVLSDALLPLSSVKADIFGEPENDDDDEATTTDHDDREQDDDLMNMMMILPSPTSSLTPRQALAQLFRSVCWEMERFDKELV